MTRCSAILTRLPDRLWLNALANAQVVCAAVVVLALAGLFPILNGGKYKMSANASEYMELFGSVQDGVTTTARCACVACNACTCACSCRAIPDMGDVEW